MTLPLASRPKGRHSGNETLDAEGVERAQAILNQR